MKIAGVSLDTLHEEVLVLTRGEQDIVIRARAVKSMDDFEKLCPDPKPPGVRVKGGVFVPNLEDANYKKELERHGEKRLAYMVIKSLEATVGLEWEVVKPGNSQTWLEWKKELTDANFSSVEINRIIGAVLAANSLDEKKLEEARKSFLAGQGKASDTSSGLSTEQESSPSGQLVNA